MKELSNSPLHRERYYEALGVREQQESKRIAMPQHLVPVAEGVHELVAMRDQYLDNNIVFSPYDSELPRLQAALAETHSVRQKADLFRREPMMQSVHLKTMTGFGDWDVVEIIKGMANAVIFQHKVDEQEKAPDKVFHLDKLKSYSKKSGLKKTNTAACYFLSNQMLRHIFKDAFDLPVSMGLRIEGLLDLTAIDDEEVLYRLQSSVRSTQATIEMTPVIKRYLTESMEEQRAPLYPTNASIFIYRHKPAFADSTVRETEPAHITGEQLRGTRSRLLGTGAVLLAEQESAKLSGQP